MYVQGRTLLRFQDGFTVAYSSDTHTSFPVRELLFHNRGPWTPYRPPRGFERDSDFNVRVEQCFACGEPVGGWNVVLCQSCLAVLRRTGHPPGARLRASLSGKRAAIPADTRRRIFRRDGYACVYCGTRSENRGEDLEIDHRLPVKWGGTDVDENLAASCVDCNRKKGTRMDYEPTSRGECSTDPDQ
jgi:5-methylcytosine-specific restriction endonuclease McrA